jgi:hypothetical protein
MFFLFRFLSNNFWLWVMYLNERVDRLKHAIFPFHKISFYKMFLSSALLFIFLYEKR